MKHTTLACFQGFQCMAGSCPDSCCRAGWEIVIDPRTMDRVKLLPGPDAARVRSAVVDGEEPIWQNRDGVCTLLDPDGLCHLQRHYGPEALCRVCRDYPRFRRFYGARTEHGLSLSCPEALRLLLRPGADLSPVSWEDNAPIEPNDLDAETWMLLQEGRAAALALLRREDLPAEDRFLLVPEGKEAPEGLDEDIKVLQKPIDRIYLAATASMAMFVSMDALDHVRMPAHDHIDPGGDQA